MLYRNCGKCARITKHDYNTEQEIEEALEQHRQESKEGATW